MNYIFDTSIIIDALRRGVKARGVFAEFDKTDDNLFISSITGFELFSGESSKNNEQSEKINRLLGHFTVVDLTWKISKMAGNIYRDGVKGLEVPDYIVAATAMEIGAQVVTLNKKHFTKIFGINIYPSG
jgi:tRNA(fMet)-specific endonuclease VapC